MTRRPAVILLLLLLLAFPLFSTGIDTYCFDSLSDTEQLAYQAMQDCITHLIPTWNCGSMSQETIQRAYDCLLMDHPEIYWSTGYTYVTSFLGNSIAGHRVEFTFNMKRDEILARNKEIEAALMEMADEIGRIDPSYETVKAVYEYLVSNCTYDDLNLDQSLCSVMLDKSGVCASFSKAFEFILQCFEIPCTVVYGRLTQSEGMLNTTLGHEWNLVQLDGKWYHVDVTSGLAVSKEAQRIDYRFLCTTTEEILKTHVIDNAVPIPDCSSDDLEFYRYHGMCVDTYSREALAECMLTAMDLGYGPVAKFSTYHAFTDAIYDLFTKQGIFQAIFDATGLVVDTLDYTIEEDQLIIRLLL